MYIYIYITYKIKGVHNMDTHPYHTLYHTIWHRFVINLLDRSSIYYEYQYRADRLEAAARNLPPLHIPYLSYTPSRFTREVVHDSAPTYVPDSPLSILSSRGRSRSP